MLEKYVNIAGGNDESNQMLKSLRRLFKVDGDDESRSKSEYPWWSTTTNQSSQSRQWDDISTNPVN